MCFHWFFLPWTHFARTVCVDPSLLGKKEDDEDRMPGIDLNRWVFKCWASLACQLGLSACQPIIAYQVEERGRSRSRECCPLEEPSSSVASRVVSDSESQTSQRLRVSQSLFPRIFEESFEALAEREERCDSCSCWSKQSWGVVLWVGKLCNPTRDFLERLTMSRSLQVVHGWIKRCDFWLLSFHSKALETSCI